MSRAEIVYIAFDARGNVVVHNDDVGVLGLQVGLKLGEVVGLHHLATLATGGAFGTIPVGAGCA